MRRRRRRGRRGRRKKGGEEGGGQKEEKEGGEGKGEEGEGEESDGGGGGGGGDDDKDDDYENDEERIAPKSVNKTHPLPCLSLIFPADMDRKWLFLLNRSESFQMSVYKPMLPIKHKAKQTKRKKKKKERKKRQSILITPVIFFFFFNLPVFTDLFTHYLVRLDETVPEDWALNING